MRAKLWVGNLVQIHALFEIPPVMSCCHVAIPVKVQRRAPSSSKLDSGTLVFDCSAGDNLSLYEMPVKEHLDKKLMEENNSHH
jgi:hypothetical protein